MTADMIRGFGIAMMIYGTLSLLGVLLRWYFSRRKP